MKFLHPAPAIAKLFFSVLFLTISHSAFAQKINQWKGGTPGREKDWHCSKNWTANVVPDEFSTVLIPDVSSSTFASPVIRSGKVELNSLHIESTALLTIEPAAYLIVHGEATGINGSNLSLRGKIQIHHNRKDSSSASAALKFKASGQ